MTRTANTYLVLALVSGCAGGTASVANSGDDSPPGSDHPNPVPADGGTSSATDAGSGAAPQQPTYPTAHPRIYLGANRARLAAALTAKTPEAATFQSVVDAWVAGANQWGFTSWNAALMGQLTGDAKYCTAAIADVELQVSTAEAAIAAGTAPVVAGDSYLYVGDDIGNLALVYDWCNSTITAAQKTRWLAYADQAVANVWNASGASWGGKAMAWDGWATNDAMDNYYYSFLRATMLLGLATKGEDPQADNFITQFRTTKLKAQLFPAFDADLVGGGSREGTSYGVAMRRLWELYDWWHATTGEVLATLTPQTRASILSFMHQTLPTLDRVAPTGDQARDSTASYFDYDRQYLAELAAMFATDPLAPRATYLNAHSSIPAMTEPFMAEYDLLYAPPVAATTLDGMGTAYYAPGIGQLYARSGWDVHATWINLIAGPYTESHAHQDQGSLMFYKDGWLAYDAVIDSASGLRQETNAHGLVRIDRTAGGAAIPQVAPTTSKLVALQAGTGWLYAAADVTAAYNGDPAISQVQREILFLQPDVVVVFDRVTSTSGTQQTWQLASPVAPAISGTTATFTNAGHTLRVQRLAPAAATASTFDYIDDPSGDYKSGYRLDETMPGGAQRYLHVMSVDGAAVTATAMSATSASITLNDGRVAVVTFQSDTIGASLTLSGVATPLAASVATLPE